MRGRKGGLLRSSDDRNWELIEAAIAAESSGKSPRLFSSHKTLFGIPSALDRELAALEARGDSPQSEPENRLQAKTKAAAQLQPALNAEAASTAQPDAGTQPPPQLESEAEASPQPAPHRTPEPTPQQPHPATGRIPAKPTLVEHPLPPVYDGNSRVLVLGTMPSPKSRETGFYYNHPQNRFWKIMAALFDEPLPAGNDEKRQLVLRHGIALWDVLARCTIEGASDGTIADCVPNNLGVILAEAPIGAVFCTGAKAAELYRRHCEATTGIPAVRLPSTSPANAAVSLDQLIEAYRAILPYCIG